MRWLVLSAVLLCACGKELVIESDTSWQGSIDEYGDVSGRGDQRFDLPAGQNICWSVTKLTSLGTLRAYAEGDSWFGLGTDVDQDAVTTAPNGHVEGCLP